MSACLEIIDKTSSSRQWVTLQLPDLWVRVHDQLLGSQLRWVLFNVTSQMKEQSSRLLCFSLLTFHTFVMWFTDHTPFVIVLLNTRLRS